VNSPQLENGYTKIANEIIDKLVAYRIPGEQMQCLLFIIRKTYGYGKKEDYISNSQFCEATGLKKGNVSRAIKELEEKKVVIKNDNRKIPSYRFNKYYGQWTLLSKKQPVINITTEVIKNDNKVLSKVMDTKEKKETSTKEKNNIMHFDTFWKLYPEKKGKKPCRKKWKLRKLDQIAEQIISDVEWRIKNDKKWLDGFIPNPLTYINQDRWDDEHEGNAIQAQGLSELERKHMERLDHGDI